MIYNVSTQHLFISSVQVLILKGQVRQINVTYLYITRLLLCNIHELSDKCPLEKNVWQGTMCPFGQNLVFV